MAREIYAVLLTLGPAHQAAALEALRELAARLLPGARLTGVVVDNALGGKLELELDSAFTRVSGDNSCREFSGWDRGLEWLESAHSVAGDDLVLLANDTLHRSYGRDYLDGFTAPLLRHGGLVGWVDAYPREVTLFGQPVQRWLRTSLVVSTRGVIDRLRPFALPFSDEEIFTSDAAQLFRTPSPLSDNYRQYLRTWLFGEPGAPEFDERWHSAAPLSSTNLAAFRGKIRSILSEHHLGARARALDVPLVDVRQRRM